MLVTKEREAVAIVLLPYQRVNNQKYRPSPLLPPQAHRKITKDSSPGGRHMRMQSHLWRRSLNPTSPHRWAHGLQTWKPHRQRPNRRSDYSLLPHICTCNWTMKTQAHTCVCHYHLHWLRRWLRLKLQALLLALLWWRRIMSRHYHLKSTWRLLPRFKHHHKLLHGHLPSILKRWKTKWVPLVSQWIG